MAILGRKSLYSFWVQAIQCRYSRDSGSKGRYHGNQFWDHISCKWTLTGENDMRFSYKGWFVFSQALGYVCWSLSLDS